MTTNPISPSAARIAVIVPCYNEEAAIGQVVHDFRRALPQADIYVYDNNSKDRTADVARAAGAIVVHEPLQGKGNVVRRMFADVDADIYVMVDGDATYDAASAQMLIDKLCSEQLDMVNGARVEASGSQKAYRPGHRFGNALLTGIVAKIFGNRFGDMLSGYRIFSRRFVKSFPSLSKGFEIETELTVHALQLRMPVGEAPTPYGDRPEGSVSKLSTYRDGFRILMLILRLVKEELPLQFFGALAAIFFIASVGFAIPVVHDFIKTGLVPRLPTAVLSASLMIVCFLCISCGLILETVTRGRIEAKRLAYLRIGAPPRVKAS